MKILILQGIIPHYRKPLFNGLSNYHDVTVLHSGEKSKLQEDQYQEIIVKDILIAGFHFQQNVYSTIKKGNYDVIIAMFDMRYIWLYWLTFSKLRKKLILWGIGLASNTKSLAQKPIVDSIRFFIVKNASSIILYSEITKDIYINNNIDSNKIYVANNTIYVESPERTGGIRNSIIFVGALSKRKRIDVLIKAFKKAQLDDEIKLIIIGKGTEKEFLQTLCKDLGIKNNVVFTGEINDFWELKKYYGKALASVSPGQAGLSVLQSFAHGVPFISSKNAITGGELYNIQHNFNGFLLDEENEIITELSKYLKKITNNTIAKELGENSFEYFIENRTMQNMVNNFIKAIDHTKNKAQ